MSELPRKSGDGAPDPVPHMVTRHIPASHNFMAGGQYVEARSYQEQRGWKVDADGLHAWSMTPDGARRMWERLYARRQERRDA